jgi:uncharacterized protein YbjT (DUF2867 family)
MKIVVIGGSGLIGSKVVKILNSQGHETISASPSSGVDATTGKGLSEALNGSQVVVDVSNSPSFDEKAAVEFFEKSNRNLSAAEKKTGVRHHIALSVVGADLLATNGYFRAKNIQEQLIKASGIPYTIVRATQFYEFLNSIAQSATIEQKVRLPPVSFQPIAADDVAAILADIAVNPPLNDTIEIAGPERARFPNLIQRYLKATQETATVTADADARYFGTVINEETLVPGKNPRLGPTTLDSWLKNQVRKDDRRSKVKNQGSV